MGNKSYKISLKHKEIQNAREKNIENHNRHSDVRRLYFFNEPRGCEKSFSAWDFWNCTFCAVYSTPHFERRILPFFESRKI